MDLIFLDICLLLLACGFMVNTERLISVGYVFGLVVSFLSCKLAFLLFESFDDRSPNR